MGVANVTFGIKITRKNDSFILSQPHYVENMLKKFGYYDCKFISILYDLSLHLFKHKGDSVSQIEYACIISRLMYLMNCTRFDIAYAINRLSRYTHNHNKDHWITLTRIMRYLKGTNNFGLLYSGYPSVLEGYTNAN
ncbi:hypothetical protein AAHE18_U050200 [Arachis hypogaea]